MIKYKEAAKSFWDIIFAIWSSSNCYILLESITLLAQQHNTNKATRSFLTISCTSNSFSFIILFGSYKLFYICLPTTMSQYFPHYSHLSIMTSSKLSQLYIVTSTTFPLKPPEIIVTSSIITSSLSGGVTKITSQSPPSQPNFMTSSFLMATIVTVTDPLLPTTIMTPSPLVATIVTSNSPSSSPN